MPPWPELPPPPPPWPALPLLPPPPLPPPPPPALLLPPPPALLLPPPPEAISVLRDVPGVDEVEQRWVPALLLRTRRILNAREFLKLSRRQGFWVVPNFYSAHREKR
jgi:hypothetical protein